MIKFNTITNFIAESEGDVNKIMNVNAQQEVVKDYDDHINFAFDIVLENNLESKLFNGMLTNEDIIPFITEASIIDWFKDKGEKVKDKAKDALTGAEEFVKKVGGNFKGIAKTIGKALSEFFQKAWAWTQKTVNSALGANAKKEALEKAVSGQSDEDKKGTEGEVKDLKSIAKATLEYFIKGVPKAAAQGAMVSGKQVEVGSDAKNEQYEWSEIFEHAAYIAFAEEIKKDSSVLNEIESFDLETINEGGAEDGIKIPFISKIVHWIAANVPPFSLLAKVENWVAKQVGHGLEKFSMWASKIAKAPGPKKFPHLAKVVGLMAGYASKGGVKWVIGQIAKKGIGLAIISAFPGVTTILKWMKKIATWIWYIEVIETALGMAVKGAGAVAGKGKGEKARQAINKATQGSQIGTKGLDKVKKKIGDTATKTKKALSSDPKFRNA
jgi:hypothetical protein